MNIHGPTCFVRERACAVDTRPADVAAKEKSDPMIMMLTSQFAGVNINPYPLVP